MRIRIIKLILAHLLSHMFGSQQHAQHPRRNVLLNVALHLVGSACAAGSSQAGPEVGQAGPETNQVKIPPTSGQGSLDQPPVNNKGSLSTLNIKDKRRTRGFREHS